MLMFKKGDIIKYQRVEEKSFYFMALKDIDENRYGDGDKGQIMSLQSGYISSFIWVCGQYSSVIPTCELFKD